MLGYDSKTGPIVFGNLKKREKKIIQRNGKKEI
jgi:hypothetical protein